MKYRHILKAREAFGSGREGSHAFKSRREGREALGKGGRLWVREGEAFGSGREGREGGF